LDNNLLDTFIDYRPYEHVTKNYSLVLNGLTNEWRTLKIDVSARTFYKTTTSAKNPLEHFMNTSATINFNIIAENKKILLTIDETATIPEFSSWPVLPLFLTVTLAVTLCRKKLTKNR
jgi:hypothetical protein